MTTSTIESSPPRQRPRLAGWAKLPLSMPIALLAAAAGGISSNVAFPAVGWWPLAFIAIILALLSVEGRTLPESALVGAAFGAAFFFPHLSWAGSFLGDNPWSWVPWVALASAETLLMAALTPVITLAYRWFPVPRNCGGRILALSALVSGAWMVREIFLSSWPYGGFPWGRLGMTQSASPFAQITSWVGVSGLGFIMVMLCAIVLELVKVSSCNHGGDPATGGAWGGLARKPRKKVIAVVAGIGILAVVPQYPTEPAGSLRVGAVQGNGPAAYADVRQPGKVLDAQLAASQGLEGEDVDLVLWPEGGVDLDPIEDANTALRLTSAVRTYDAPILLNAAVETENEVYNRSVLWTETGPAGSHAKRHPVPFGEYIPDRWLYEKIAPGLVDMLQREYLPGDEPPLLETDGVETGLAICFDVVFDEVITESVLGGSQVHLFQTNNADFRGTDEHLQQLAFARMRGIETGRSVVNLSTTGSSQAFDPAGNTIADLPVNTAGAMVVDVELRDGVTAGVALGPWIREFLLWGTLLSLAGLGLRSWAKRVAARHPETMMGKTGGPQ